MVALTRTSIAAETPFKAYAGIHSVADIVNEQLLTYAGRTAIRFDDGTGYRSIDFSEYHRRIVQMVRLLQGAGAVQRVIATLCKNRLEWDMTALAAFYTANILFPLDVKLDEVELDHLLALSRPDYVLVSRAQLSRLRGVAGRLGLAAQILVADLTETFEDAGTDRAALEPGEASLATALACHEGAEGPVVESALLGDPATILGHYATSGTISLPKVVRISHGNIVAEVNCAFDLVNLRTNEEVLNIGPYTHIATLVEFLVSKSRGYTVAYFTREPDEDDVLEDELAKLRRQGARIRALAAVPKLWVYLLKEVLEEMKNKPALRKLYQHLTQIERNDALQDIGTIERAKLTAARILLRNKLGGYFSYGISSSTKLDGALVRILGRLGITLIDVYGATECTGIVARNELADVVPGSCGKVVRQVEWRLADARRVPGLEREVGILHVKGPTVASRYAAADGEGASIAGTDGYYSTGDLCWVEQDRQLYIVGREKELLRWDDGTLIDPQALSNLPRPEAPRGGRGVPARGGRRRGAAGGTQEALRGGDRLRGVRRARHARAEQGGRLHPPPEAREDSHPQDQVPRGARAARRRRAHLTQKGERSWRAERSASACSPTVSSTASSRAMRGPTWTKTSSSPGSSTRWAW
jgi:long-subunit acyl-CoA synthetase (AMP-forming)